MEFDWLEDSFPCVLLSERLLTRWRGADSEDYAQASSSSDNWLSVIPVGDGFGLVLGGDPAAALTRPCDDGDVVLIRWVFSENERELVDFALRGEGVKRTEPDLEILNQDRSWRMFYAARFGDELCDARSVTLPVGRLRIRTTWLESGSNSAIVHRFSKQD